MTTYKTRPTLMIATVAMLFLAVACDGSNAPPAQPTSTVIVEQQATPTAASMETPTTPQEPTPQVGTGITPNIMQPTRPPTGGTPSGSETGGSGTPINKSANLGNLLVTVNSMRRWEGDATSQPQAGNEYLILDITLQNTGSKEQVFLLSEARVVDSENKRYRGADVTTSKGRPNGLIAVGETKNGEWPVEVSKAATGLILMVDSTAAGHGKIEIPLEP